MMTNATRQPLALVPEPIWLRAKDLAVYLRAELASRWPSVRFSVRSESFSQGSAVRVAWTDGPTQADVQPVLNAFEGKSFDGMTDSTSFHVISLPDGTRAKCGAWVTGSRAHSDTAKALALRLYEQRYRRAYQPNDQLPDPRDDRRTIYGSDGLRRIETALRFTKSGYVMVKEYVQ